MFVLIKNHPNILRTDMYNRKIISNRYMAGWVAERGEKLGESVNWFTDLLRVQQILDQFMT